MTGILAVIPARGGSKGIPLKNMAVVGGRPLLAWTVEAALEANRVDRVAVSTDHPEIAQLAQDLGADVVMRPPELAGDAALTRPVIQHAWEEMERRGFDAHLLATLQPTSPMRDEHHIDAAIKFMDDHPGADSLVTVQEVPHQFSPGSLMSVEGEFALPCSTDSVLRRQDKLQYWARNGAAIYLTRSECIQDFVWGGKTLAFPMDKIASVDIDDQSDLIIVDALLKAQMHGTAGGCSGAD